MTDTASPIIALYTVERWKVVPDRNQIAGKPFAICMSIKIRLIYMNYTKECLTITVSITIRAQYAN